MSTMTELGADLVGSLDLEVGRALEAADHSEYQRPTRAITLGHMRAVERAYDSADRVEVVWIRFRLVGDVRRDPTSTSSARRRR